MSDLSWAVGIIVLFLFIYAIIKDTDRRRT